MAYYDKADGILKAILIVEGFDFDTPPEPGPEAYCGRGPCCMPRDHDGKCEL